MSRVGRKAPPTDAWRAGDGPVSCGRISRFFLWCGAVDRDELATRAEAYRYANLGVLVFGVALLGATTFAVFMIIVIGRFTPLVVPAAVGWGLFIFTIDRTIVAEPSYKERQAHELLERLDRTPGAPVPKPSSGSVNGSAPQPAAGHVRQAVSSAEVPPAKPAAARIIRGGTYLLRIAITACLAFLIADGLMLLMFHPEVAQQLSALHAKQFDQQAATFVNNQQNVIGQLNDTLLTDTAAQKAQQATVIQDRATAAEEAYGLAPDGLHGPGPVYSQDLASLNQDTTRLDRLTKQVAGDRTALAAEQTFLAKVADQDSAALADPRASALAAQRTAVYGDNGFDEQEKAFSAFLSSDKGDPVAVAAPWAVRAILVCFDLMPLGAKLLNPYTIYGRRMTERGLLIRYRDTARLKAQLADVDHQASMAALRASDDYQLSVADAGWRRSWRMTYLGDRH